MLFVPPDQAKPTRIQGAYVSEAEIRVIPVLLASDVKPSYADGVTGYRYPGQSFRIKICYW